jgi:hypothetical protein
MDAAGSHDDRALTITNRRGAGFSQQGTVDWVNLGQMQFNASVAILGRMAAAGVDTLTVAYGQAMCCAIPIGQHGERVLQNQMKKLKAFSSFGDIIWFGVGVRHILRDLVQSAQGCSLVALCAALTEGYSNEVSSFVLYEAARLSGGPSELRPSVMQWTSLIKASASVFNESTLGLRIEQLRRLNEVPATARMGPSHPTDLAAVILNVGKIVAGSLQTLNVRGGPACSWIAAWAEFVLGLRVQVWSKQGQRIFANYNETLQLPQLVVTFQEQLETVSAVQCVGHSVFVPDGGAFIEQCFGRQGLSRNFLAAQNFKGGRVSRDSLFHDTFGSEFDDVLLPPNKEVTLNEFELQTQIRHVLIQLLVSGAIVLVEHTPIRHRFSNHQVFLLWLMDTLPELQGLSRDLSTAAQARPTWLSAGPKSKLSAEARNISEYLAALGLLHRICGCPKCYSDRYLEKERTRTPRMTCFAVMAEVVVMIAYLEANVIFDGQICPTRLGLLELYDSASRNVGHTGSAEEVLLRLTRGTDLSVDERLSVYLRLYSEPNENFQFETNRSAISDGKVYCYIDALRALTDVDYQSSLVHVGSGCIEYSSRLRSVVYDQESSGEVQYYPARRVDNVTSTEGLGSDTSTQGFSVEARVADVTDVLSFWYLISSRAGITTISPAKLTKRLGEATSYLRAPLVGNIASNYWRSLLEGHRMYVIAEGEGDLHMVEQSLVLRPLRNNLVGRCVSIYKSRQPVALVRNDAELENFAKWWWQHRQANEEHPDRIKYHALVS